MKIAIIGTGNLGSSIAKGLIKNKTFTSLYLSDKNTAAVNVFSDEDYVTITSDNVLTVQESDIVIFALQPRHIDKVLESVSSSITEDHVIMSVAAGFEISKIESIIGSDRNIIRVMPNTAISIGKSMTCLAANEKGQSKMGLAKKIFNQLGCTIQGLNAMEHQGLSSALIQGIVASFEKINQLKQT